MVTRRWAGAVVVGLVAFAGCTAAEVDREPRADPTSTRTSEPAPAEPSVATGRRAPRVSVVSGRDDGRYLTLITWGSSSCRFHVSSTRVVEGVLEIADTTPPDRRCTADFSRNVTHRPLDPGLDLSAVDHALVRFKDRPAVTVLVAFGME